MKELLNVLTDREKEILILREKKVPYKMVGEQFGISQNRARQLFIDATKKLRDAQRKLLAAEANQMVVLTPLTRSDLIIISEALHKLQEARMSTITHTLGNLSSVMDEDPVYGKAEQVLEKIETQLQNTREEVSELIAAKLPDALVDALNKMADEQQNSGTKE